MPSEKSRRRIQLAEAQNWRCAYCTGVMDIDGTKLDGATIEHLVPLMHGGARGIENLIAACQACNRMRSDFFSARAFRKLRRNYLRKGRWPPCTLPSRKVARRVGKLLSVMTERRSQTLLAGRVKRPSYGALAPIDEVDHHAISAGFCNGDASADG